jgi:hypothetical protein
MDTTGAPIGGNQSDRVFENVVDFDATSLYPSIILATNIDATGQCGRLVLPQPDGTDADSSLLMQAWASGDPLEVGARWLGLPDLADLCEIVFADAEQETT